jgi:hypothetical protein
VFPMIFVIFAKIWWLESHELTSGFSILLHWSVCLFWASTMLGLLLWLCSIIWCQVF